jgi:hypothetical protein
MLIGCRIECVITMTRHRRRIFNNGPHRKVIVTALLHHTNVLGLVGLYANRTGIPFRYGPISSQSGTAGGRSRFPKPRRASAR